MGHPAPATKLMLCFVHVASVPGLRRRGACAGELCRNLLPFLSRAQARTVRPRSKRQTWRVRTVPREISSSGRVRYRLGDWLDRFTRRFVSVARTEWSSAVVLFNAAVAAQRFRILRSLLHGLADIRLRDVSTRNSTHAPRIRPQRSARLQLATLLRVR